ncbi:MAG: uridine kinase [bacterium]|nr:uridine kinase [bacterium]
MGLEKERYLLGIAGASGSGKTFLASKFKEIIGKDFVEIVTVDSYYKQQDHLSLEERANVNYDHPDSLDLELLTSHLKELKSGHEVNVPVYDFALHNRSKNVVTVSPKKCLIVEGILTFHNESVRSLLNYKIFVDTPTELCFERRMARDIVERGRTKESVVSQWHDTVLPMFKKYCSICINFADMTCLGDSSDFEFITALSKQIFSKKD